MTLPCLRRCTLSRAKSVKRHCKINQINILLLPSFLQWEKQHCCTIVIGLFLFKAALLFNAMLRETYVPCCQKPAHYKCCPAPIHLYQALHPIWMILDLAGHRPFGSYVLCGSHVHCCDIRVALVLER